jgi:hypothetical protein
VPSSEGSKGVTVGRGLRAGDATHHRQPVLFNGDKRKVEIRAASGWRSGHRCWSTGTTP